MSSSFYSSRIITVLWELHRSAQIFSYHSNWFFLLPPEHPNLLELHCLRYRLISNPGQIISPFELRLHQNFRFVYISSNCKLHFFIAWCSITDVRTPNCKGTTSCVMYLPTLDSIYQVTKCLKSLPVYLFSFLTWLSLLPDLLYYFKALVSIFAWITTISLDYESIWHLSLTSVLQILVSEVGLLLSLHIFLKILMALPRCTYFKSHQDLLNI